MIVAVIMHVSIFSSVIHPLLLCKFVKVVLGYAVDLRMLVDLSLVVFNTGSDFIGTFFISQFKGLSNN